MPPDFDLPALVDARPRTASREAFEDDSIDPMVRFKLRIRPFSDSVNPDLFFRTEAHDRAFVEMRRCVEDNVSLGLCTAPSGTGKTLLTQILLGAFDPRRYRALLTLVYPGMTQVAMLREIVSELSLVPSLATRVRLHDLVTLVHEEIMRLHQQNIKLIVIIDEVHFLRADCLHLVRTLSNIEVPERKLVTVLLFGEETFLKKMDNPAYRSLFSRMFVRVGLRALNADEVEQYVKYRILMAGGRPSLFTPSCFPLIAGESRGVPREINRICENALTSAARRLAPAVEPVDIRR